MSKRGPKHGRPTKLTADIQARVVQALRGGNFRTVACAWAGISDRTFRDWMREGKAHPTSAAGTFRRSVMEAEKAAEITAVALIMKAAQADPKHAQWWLTHRHPERWAEKKRVELTGKDGGPVRMKSKLNAKLAGEVNDADRTAGILEVLARAGALTFIEGPGEPAAADDPQADSVHPASSPSSAGSIPPSSES